MQKEVLNFELLNVSKGVTTNGEHTVSSEKYKAMLESFDKCQFFQRKLIQSENNDDMYF